MACCLRVKEEECVTPPSKIRRSSSKRSPELSLQQKGKGKGAKGKLAITCAGKGKAVNKGANAGKGKPGDKGKHGVSKGNTAGKGKARSDKTGEEELEAAESTGDAREEVPKKRKKVEQHDQGAPEADARDVGQEIPRKRLRKATPLAEEVTPEAVKYNRMKTKKYDENRAVDLDEYEMEDEVAQEKLKDTQAERKKRKDAKEATTVEVSEPSSDKKKKKKKDVAERKTEEAGEYPESPGERLKLKSQSAGEDQAGAACGETQTRDGGKQRRLEQLQHVVRTPRTYSYTETGRQQVPMQQLEISDFWQDAGDESTKEKKRKEKSKAGESKDAGKGKGKSKGKNKGKGKDGSTTATSPGTCLWLLFLNSCCKTLTNKHHNSARPVL